MKFIILTARIGKGKIYINPAFISSLCEAADEMHKWTDVYCTGEESSYRVIETPEQIISLIKSAGE